MAKQLSYQPLSNFGVNGLNTQSNPNALDPSYLVSADNIVLRESGRISFRKGFKQKVVPTGTPIGSMVEHTQTDGTNKIFASHGTSIYTIDFTTPNAAFPSSGADVKRTVANSTSDWQFVNFNNRLHCFHAGVSPQRYDSALGSNVKWSAHHSSATAINLADASQITAPNIAINKTYKITALGNTNFFLAGCDTTPAVGEIFTSVTTGALARDALFREANKMEEGKSYKIIALGNTNFNLNGADSSPAVDEVFTANAILGIGTGLVVEVIAGTTGTIIEIKTNPTLTTITVDSTSGYATNGKILIDDEIISYTGITSTTFTGCGRGSSGTVAVFHNNNDVVSSATKPETVVDFDPSCGMGSYGKLWAGGVTESPDIIYYSVLLDGDDWNGVGSGFIDLKTVWGTDDIVAIAAFFGKLVIFGKNNIVIYDNPHSGGTLALNEVIKGVGLVSRDSIQSIGDDLVFLSETGLRSLARTTEKDKLPMTDLSLLIKDTLIRNIGQSKKVKSVYLENEGIYIMSFVDLNVQYVFDFKHATPEGTPRITTWSFDNDRQPASMIQTVLYSGLLIGQKDGSIAGYEGYFDTDMSFVSSAVVFTNNSITVNVASIWIPMGESMAASILKKLILVLEGGSGAVLGLKWYKDFSINPSPTTILNLTPATTGTTSLWGASTSRYGALNAGGAHASSGHNATLHPSASTFAPVFGLEEYQTALTGSAKHLKLNLSIVSNGYDTSIQDLSLISLQGKIR